MKMKNLLILLVVLLVASTAIFFARKKTIEGPPKEQRLFFPGFDINSVFALVVEEKDSLAKVEKRSGKWVVPGCGNHRADTAKIKKALRALKTLERRQLISVKKEKHEEFQINDSLGRKIMAIDPKGKKLASLIVGTSGFNWSGYYNRKEGSNKVYSTNQSSKWEFYTSNSEWMDNDIWNLDKDKIKRFEIRHDTVHIACKRGQDTAWLPDLGVKAVLDSEKVEYFVESMCGLESDDWINEADSVVKTAFDKPKAYVTLDDGVDKYQITAGAMNGLYHYIKVSGDTTVHKVFNYKVENMQKKWRDLDTSYTPPPNIDSLLRS